MKKRLPPCIKGLEAFKKGCPQKPWDGEEGCPAWREYIVSTRENPLTKETRRQCIEIWNHEYLWACLGCLEGNQQAIESFRNNMSVPGAPKPDPALARIAEIMEVQQQAKLLRS